MGKHKDKHRDDETGKGTREDALPKRKPLCDLEKHVKEQLEAFKELVRTPTHVCRKCGRASNAKARLCRPEPL